MAPTLPAAGSVPGVADLGRIVATIGLTALACVPLALSLWALLDCAHRPAWAWAFAGRSQAVWMAIILCGFLTVIGGLIVASVYLLRIRPVIAAAETGRLPGAPPNS